MDRKLHEDGGFMDGCTSEKQMMDFRKQTVKMSLSSQSEVYSRFLWLTASHGGALEEYRFQLLPNYMSVWNAFSGATAL